MECLGIEFEVVSDDNEDEYADDEASLLLASEDKVEIIIEQDRPWWVQLFEDLDLVMKLVMVPLWKRITKWPQRMAAVILPLLVPQMMMWETGRNDCRLSHEDITRNTMRCRQIQLLSMRHR